MRMMSGCSTPFTRPQRWSRDAKRATAEWANADKRLIAIGHVNLNETAHAVAEGAVIGAVTGGTARCHSFDPSTEVLLADGTTKPIGEIKLGDRVVSSDPLTGATAARTVSLLHHNHDTDLANATVKDAKAGKKSVVQAQPGAVAIATTRSTAACSMSTIHALASRCRWRLPAQSALERGG